MKSVKTVQATLKSNSLAMKRIKTEKNNESVIHSSILLINLSGFPATMELSGTSLVTTLPAPTMEFSPIVTPGSIVDAIPIHAFFLIWIGFAYVALLFSGLKS